MSERWPGGIVRSVPITPTGPTTYAVAPGIWTLDQAAYWQKQGLWPNPNYVPDLYFNYVSLLLSSTSLGNANNNLFVDSSGAFNPVSRNGNTTQGSFTPYSTKWSNYLSNAGFYKSGALVSTTASTMTIEFWIFMTAVPVSDLSYFGSVVTLDGNPSTGTNYLNAGITTGQKAVISWYNGGNFNAQGSTTIPLNTWTHVAIVVNAGAISMYVNGVAETLTGTTTLTNRSGTDGNSCIGKDGHGYTTGYISNLRVTTTAVYTSNFTVPTAPLTAISGTVLLFCQSNRFIDASSNNFTFTLNGSPSVQEFNPFLSSTYTGISYNQSDITNWSGYFDGSGDYLQTPSNAALAMGSADFTFEWWQNLSTAFRILGNLPGGSWTTNRWVVGCDSGTTLVFYVNNYNAGSPMLTGTFAYNTWQHIAVTRSGSTWRLFINGTLQSTVTSSVSLDSGSSELLDIASSGIAEYATGYISNVRIVKGTAVYTSNFTPPTSALTAISGTSLLTLQNAAFADNSTNKFIITPYGNSTVTGNSPFNTTGYWSNYFDGNSYLTIPNNTALNVWDSGSGSFTVEAWIYATASIPNNTSIIAKATNDGNPGWANGWAFQVFNGYLNVNTPGDSRLFNSNTTSVPLNQWVHCALVKSGSTVSIYQNGTRVGTTTNSNAYSNTTDAVAIGVDRNLSGGGKLTGYVSNARMVKGTAVYDPTQSTLTVPTTPLTAITNTSLLTCQNGRFIDNSTNAFAITVNGSPQTQPFDPFYTSTIASNGGSMYFDGSGDYLTTPLSANLQFGTGNFTVECWTYLVSRVSLYPCIWGNYNSYTTGSLSLFAGHNSGNTTKYQVAINGAAFPVIQSSTNVAYNTWVHLAVVRNSGTITLYINGVADGTYNATGVALNGVGPSFCVGTAFDNIANGYINGYINGLRVTNGTAVYTGAFTPPTAPLTPSANTTLLLNGMNAGIYDATAINDMETVGNAQVTTAVSKYGGSSVYFDGNGDGLIGTNALVGYTPGNFTWECWVNFTSTSGNPCIIATTSGSERDLLYFNSSTGINYVINRGGVDQVTIAQGATTGWSTGTWYHVAVVRNGNTYTIYRDGTSVATGTSSYAKSNLNAPITFGYSNYSASYLYLNGYIDDARITNGVARYTANFTPPTQAFPVY